jgi:hypothetical protein
MQKIPKYVWITFIQFRWFAVQEIWLFWKLKFYLDLYNFYHNWSYTWSPLFWIRYDQMFSVGWWLIGCYLVIKDSHVYTCFEKCTVSSTGCKEVQVSIQQGPLKTDGLNYWISGDKCIYVCDRSIPYSPRWLIAKGYGPEAKRILEEGSAFKRRSVSIAEISPPPTHRWVKRSAYINGPQQGWWMLGICPHPPDFLKKVRISRKNEIYNI